MGVTRSHVFIVWPTDPARGSAASFLQRLFFKFSDNCSCQVQLWAPMILENGQKHTAGCTRMQGVYWDCSPVHCNGSGRWHPWEFHFSALPASTWRGSLAIMKHWKCVLRHFWRKLSLIYRCFLLMDRVAGGKMHEGEVCASLQWRAGPFFSALGPEGEGDGGFGEEAKRQTWGLQDCPRGGSAGIGWGRPEQNNKVAKKNGSGSRCSCDWPPGVCTNQRLSQQGQHILGQTVTSDIELPHFHWIHLKGTEWGEETLYLFSGYSQLWDI